MGSEQEVLAAEFELELDSKSVPFDIQNEYYYRHCRGSYNLYTHHDLSHAVIVGISAKPPDIN